MNDKPDQAIPYTCKNCGRDGLARYHSGCGICDLDTWKQILVCDRCADFLEKRNMIERSIKNACWKLFVARQREIKSLASVESATIDSLNGLTKRLAAISCEFYRITNVWEPEFVTLLMNNPERAGKLLLGYQSGLKSIDRQLDYTSRHNTININENNNQTNKTNGPRSTC